jgi:ribonuclease I
MEKGDCKQRVPIKNIFSIHGLWPDYISKKRISDCHVGSQILTNVQGITREFMDSFWVSCKADNNGFWNHEYNKHGYCFTQRYQESSEQKYFDMVRELYNKHAFEQLMVHSVGDINMQDNDVMEYTYESLKKAIHKARNELYFSMRCKQRRGKQYLVELHFYFDIEFSPLDHERGSNCDQEKSIFVTFE